jgi:hypothetical protein
VIRPTGRPRGRALAPLTADLIAVPGSNLALALPPTGPAAELVTIRLKHGRIDTRWLAPRR